MKKTVAFLILSATAGSGSHATQAQRGRRRILDHGTGQNRFQVLHNKKIGIQMKKASIPIMATAILAGLSGCMSTIVIWCTEILTVVQDKT